MKKERSYLSLYNSFVQGTSSEKKKKNNKEMDLWVIRKKEKRKKTTDVMRGNFKGIKIESFYFLEI